MKYIFQILFQKILTEINEKGLSWINLKLRGLKWTKAKLEDWNEIWRNLEGQFCILSLNLLWGPPYVWKERVSRHYTLEVPNNFPVLSTSLNSFHYEIWLFCSNREWPYHYQKFCFITTNLYFFLSSIFLISYQIT